MKIVFLSNSTTLQTGFGKQTLLLSREFQKRGHEVTVICGRQNGEPVVPEVSFDGFPREAVDRELHRLEPDVVIVLEGSWYEYQSVYLQSTGKTKFFWWFAFESSYIPIAERDYWRNVPPGRVCFLSEFHRQLWKPYVRGPVIPHAVDLDVWKPQGVSRQQVIGNLNRNDPRKRWDLFYEFCSNFPDYRYHVHSGDGYWNWSDLEESYGVAGRVTYTKDLPEHELVKLVSGWRVRFDSSSGEGFGCSTAELAAAGVQQVVGDHTTMREVLGPSARLTGTTPYYTDRGMFSQVVVADAVEDFRFGQEMSAACGEHVRDMFSVERVADLWEKQFEQPDHHRPHGFNSSLNKKSLTGLGKLLKAIGGLVLELWPLDGQVLETCLHAGVDVTAMTDRYFEGRLGQYCVPYTVVWPEAQVLLMTDSHWDLIKHHPDVVMEQVAKYDILVLKTDGLPPWGETRFDPFGKGLIPFRRNHDQELMMKNKWDFPYRIWAKVPETYEL